MPQISHIKYKEILEARRFDAEYFKPEFLLMEQKFELRGWASLKCYCNYIKKGIFDLSPNNYKDIGIPFIRTSEIKDPLIDFSSTVFLNEEIHKLNHKTELKAGDLVFTKIGAYIGDVSLLPRNYSVYNFSQNVTGLSIKHNEIESEFLLIYLLSKYGKKQILRSMMLSGQGKLELEDIRSLKIIDIDKSFREQIQKIVNMVEDLKENSKQLYKEAEEILLNELGLLNYEVKHSLWFTTTKKEIANAKRYDSEYYQPKYDEIIKKIEEYEGGWDYAGKIVNWKKGIEVGTEAYTDTGKDFVRVSDFSINGISETNRKISESAYFELKDNFQPKKGEILFTKDGTIGISYVLKEDVDGLLSGAFLRLKLTSKFQEFEKECLSLIFNSIICKMQVEKLSGGALIDHLKPSDFETFKIPLIKPEIQEQIAVKIKESHKLRKESKELLETAKRAVEIAIEENEETAMEYINFNVL